MQKNPVKIPAMTRLDAKLWEDSLRDVTLRGCFAISVLNVSVLFLSLGLSMEPPKLLPFYFPATVIVFLCLFTFSVALASLLYYYKANQTRSSALLSEHCHVGSFNVGFLLCTCQCAVDCYQAVPFCSWFCGYAHPGLPSSLLPQMMQLLWNG